MKYLVGDKAYITENNMRIRRVVVIRVSGEFCTLHFLDSNGGLTLRNTRLFKTQEDAKKSINRGKVIVESYFSSFDYLG